MKQYLAVVWALTHWRPNLWDRHFTCCTDHQALMYLYYVQNTSNLLTRWAIAFQKYNFTVKHLPGKLNTVPDTVSRTFSEINGSPVSPEPRLERICQNVHDDQPFHPPTPREYEVFAYNLDDIPPVEDDRELRTSAFWGFPVVNSSFVLDHRKREFHQYLNYLHNPGKPRVPPTSLSPPWVNFPFTKDFSADLTPLPIYVEGPLSVTNWLSPNPCKNLSLIYAITYPHPVVISPSRALSIKCATISDGQPCTPISYVMSKVVRLVNTAKHRTGHPKFLPVITLKLNLPSALWWILRNTRLCQNVAASCYP